MKKLTPIILLVFSAIILTSMFCGSSYAITGNSQGDSTSYVCVVVLFADVARTQPIGVSTGVLIAPSVVLTAGHSVMGVAASVCFDDGPLTYSLDENGKIVYNTQETIYNGIPTPYPAYLASVLAGAKPSQALQTSDVGLIILDTPVTEVTTYATLPTAGFCDSLAAKTQLTVIGYGVEFQTTPRGHGVETWVSTLTRNSATVNLLSSNFAGSDLYLKCSANAAQGKGGIAYGDSGGPTIYSDNGQNVVLAVNAFVGNDNCAGVTYHTRLDNPSILSWIAGYL